MKVCRLGDSNLPSPLLFTVSSGKSSPQPASTVPVTDSTLSQWLIRSRILVWMLTNSRRSRRRFRVGR